LQGNRTIECTAHQLMAPSTFYLKVSRVQRCAGEVWLALKSTTLFLGSVGRRLRRGARPTKEHGSAVNQASLILAYQQDDPGSPPELCRWGTVGGTSSGGL